jgi:guanylate kinase
MDKPLLIVVSGPSGTGKGTVCKRLMEITDNVRLSVSATTRSPRAGEVHGINYFFKTKAEFEEMINKNKFLEYAKVYDNYYGTPNDYVDACLLENDVLLEIDTQGAMMVKENAPDALYIFIAPPSLKELHQRLKGRGSESDQSLKTRTGAARDEIDMAQYYDYVVINDNVEKAALCMKHIIESEKCSIKRRREFIKNLKESEF